MRSFKILSGVLVLGGCCLATGAYAQKKAATKGNQHAAVLKGADKGFKKTAHGLEYKMVLDTHGTRKPGVGDYVEMNIHVHIGDSTLFDSRKMNNNQPVPFPIQKPQYGHEPTEGFMMMSAGDSAVFRLPIDSMKKPGQAMPQPWMKDGMMMEYDVVMVSVKSQEEMKKESEASAAKQTGIDDQILQDYFKKNNLHPMKTASGLYYKIDNPGSGAQITAGQSATVKYTGKTMDGKVFDSNVDPAFHHADQPFAFPVGRGNVIKGWDEGFLLLKPGAKATLYIPSTLAYGSRGQGGAIPPNAILIFDVAVESVK